MISWISLIVGMFIGFTLGVLATKSQSTDISDIWKKNIEMVKDSLDKKHCFHASIYVSRSDEDDGNDEDEDVELITPRQNFRDN